MKICNSSVCETCETYCSQSFNMNDYPCGTMVSPNTDTDCMMFVMSGRLSVKNDQIEEFVCEQGQIVLMTRNNDYHIEVLEDVQVLTLSFVTSYQICDKMNLMQDARPLLNSLHYKFGSLEIKEPLRIALESVLYYLKDDIHCGYWQRAKQKELFVIFFNYYTVEEICHFFYPVINKEIGFHSKVKANYIKAHTVIELAELCGYKLATFTQLFARHFYHNSPYQWMLQQKAPLIKAQLMYTTIPIKAILAEFGFTDQSYFNTYCKRYFGATAAQIRKGIE